MSTLTLDLIDSACSILLLFIVGTFVLRAAFRGRCPEIVSTIFFETRWAYPWVAAWSYVLDPILRGESFEWWDYLVIAMAVANWWGISREKDDDDRWRRRGRAAREKIVRTAAGLSVVPNPT